MQVPLCVPEASQITELFNKVIIGAINGLCTLKPYTILVYNILAAGIP